MTVTATPDLGDADPVAIVLDWLQKHPRIGEVLGAPEYVSGIPESPWPHLSLGDGPGGNMRDLWNAEFEVMLTLTDDPAGSTGPAVIRTKLLRLLTFLCHELAGDDSPPAQRGEPVVSRVRPSGMLAETPRTTGQPAWTAGVLVVVHPPIP